MANLGELNGALAEFRPTDVSSVLSNLKRSAAAMLQDKERSRHSESVWRERLTEKERRVSELEQIVHTEQQKSALIASTMQERKAQEAYLSQRVRTLTMLGSELQDRVNKLQGSVRAGDELQVHSIAQFETDKKKWAGMMDCINQMKADVDNLRAALETAKTDICSKDETIRTKEGDVDILQTKITETVQHLSASQNECTNLQNQLQAAKDSSSQLDQRLQTMATQLVSSYTFLVRSSNSVSANNCKHGCLLQEVVCQEKSALEAHAQCKDASLAQLQLEHDLVLEKKVRLEQDKISLGEEKMILEQHMAAVTAEQLQYVVTLEAKIATLEKTLHEHNLHHTQEKIKAAEDHAAEIESMHQTINEIQSCLASELDDRRTVESENQGLSTKLESLLAIDLQQRNAIIALQKDCQQLSDVLCMTKSYVVELEVERVVSRATGHAVMEKMDEANTLLRSSVQNLSLDLHNARHALDVSASDQENLSNKHFQQDKQWNEKLEVLKVRHSDAMALQHQQLETQMQCTLRVLEEQAASHVKSIQDNFDAAQRSAAIKEEECKALQEQVNDLEARVEALTRAKHAEQSQWEVKESEMRAAFEMERSALEGVVSELHEKHKKICEDHDGALHKVAANVEAVTAARQHDVQEYQAKVDELNTLLAALQSDLDLCRQELADVTADGNVKEIQIKSLEADIQKKTDLLKSISEKIGTPDADMIKKEPAAAQCTNKKRRRFQGDPAGGDARTKPSSRKHGMPPRPQGAARSAKSLKTEGRRGRMANMSSGYVASEHRMGNLTSTEIFGGLMSGF